MHVRVREKAGLNPDLMITPMNTAVKSNTCLFEMLPCDS